MSFYNVLAKNVILFRRGQWTITAATANSNSHCWPLLAVNSYRCPLQAMNSHCCYCQQLPLRACVRAYMHAEVYIYHSTGMIFACMSFYNVLAQNVIPFRRGQWIVTGATANSYHCVRVPACACVRLRASVLKYTYTIWQAWVPHVCRFITFIHKT